MKKIEILKRMAAGTLAVAIIALGTSCGKTTETTDLTAPIVSTDENKVKLEDIKDVKPTYEEGIISEKEIQVSSKLNEVVKSMINEDKYYAKNFDYYVERLTITDVKIEALENAVMPDYAGVDYAPSADKSKVTISYVADAVNKKTGDKTTESNAISYVVKSAEVANLANAEPEEIEFEVMAQAVAEGTEQKLETVAQGQTEEEDKVEGRQSNLSNWYLTNVVSKFIDEIYTKEPYKKYLDNGYTLISTTKDRRERNENCVMYREEYYGSPEDMLFGCTFITPNGYIELVDYSATTLSFGFVINTLAINGETGEMRLIVNDVIIRKELDNATSNTILKSVEDNAVVNIDKLRENVEWKDFDNKKFYGIEEIVGGLEPFKGNLISWIDYGISLKDSTIPGIYWGDSIPYDEYKPSHDTPVDDINNYKEKVIISALADKNNTDVFIKEPDN